MNRSQPGHYHHGDLRATLMELALHCIAEEGTDKLSLRALARAAGVSPTAPYRHFPTKRCLFAALATDGFRRLQLRTEAGLRDVADLEEAVIRLGMEYVEFAVQNPTTYQLMFGSAVHDFSDYPELGEAAEASYAPVLTLMERLIQRRSNWDMTATKLGGIVWSVVHGIASLLIFTIERPSPDHRLTPVRSLEELKADPETALRTLLEGVLRTP